MAISVKDLPPQYQKQAIQKILGAGKRPAKESKYHAEKAERNGETGTAIKFDSKKEADRYDVLMERLRRGEIRNLRLQVDFPITPGWTDPETGKRIKPQVYKADFTYEEPTDNSGPSYKTDYNHSDPVKWRLVVEDVKGMRTQTYINKKKCVEEKYGIRIREI